MDFVTMQKAPCARCTLVLPAQNYTSPILLGAGPVPLSPSHTMCFKWMPSSLTGTHLPGGVVSVRASPVIVQLRPERATAVLLGGKEGRPIAIGPQVSNQDLKQWSSDREAELRDLATSESLDAVVPGTSVSEVFARSVVM